MLITRIPKKDVNHTYFLYTGVNEHERKRIDAVPLPKSPAQFLPRFLLFCARHPACSWRPNLTTSTANKVGDASPSFVNPSLPAFTLRSTITSSWESKNFSRMVLANPQIPNWSDMHISLTWGCYRVALDRGILWLWRSPYLVGGATARWLPAALIRCSGPTVFSYSSTPSSADITMSLLVKRIREHQQMWFEQSGDEHSLLLVIYHGRCTKMCCCGCADVHVAILKGKTCLSMPCPGRISYWSVSMAGCCFDAISIL
jgi:hypothetical protein